MQERFTKPKGWLWGQFTGVRGEPLRFGVSKPHEAPVAHIVYVEGLGEFAEKTFELARDFNRMSYNFSVLDRYGQGQSQRYFRQSDKQHSDGVEKDVDDLIRYCREHIPAGEKVVLLGHSTGGLITMLALAKAPDLFKAAVITAPLLGFADKLARNKEELWARSSLPDFVKNHYAPGGSEWKPRHRDLKEKQVDAYSADTLRNKVSDIWQTKDTGLRAGSPSMGWAYEMCKALAGIRKSSFAARVTQPVIFFTGGRDLLVNNSHTAKMAGRLAGAVIHHYPDGGHELLMETDDIRDDVLAKADGFLKKNL